MIAAQAAARAHHLKAAEHDRISREENFRRSQLMLGDGSEREADEYVEDEPINVPDHLLGVPLKDRDCGQQEAEVSLRQYYEILT